MFNKLINIFKKKDLNQLLDEVHKVAVERQTEEEAYDLEYTRIDGPFQKVLKILNKQSIRMIRIELPKEDNKEQRIAVHLLERTHDVLEDIDNFYQGKTIFFDKLSDVLYFIKVSSYFGTWIKEPVDRMHDREVINGKLMEHAEQVPEIGTALCAYIRKVLILDFQEDKTMMSLMLKGPQGRFVKVITVPRSVSRSFAPGSIYVLTPAGKEVGLAFGKCRKYILFNKDDWRSIRNMLG